MKKIIALLLALAMIFAFAACKGKDDETTTDENSSQSAEVDVTAESGADETQAAVTDENGSTVAAPSEGSSEAATKAGETVTKAGEQSGTKQPAAASISAPVNGSKAEIVAFFNKYATAMKQYTGKVTVKRVQGTTSKINSISGGSAIASVAEPLLPNDYPQTETKTFSGGKASDGTTLAKFLPASKLSAYNVDPAGVKTASCVAQGSGWKVSITLIPESGEGLTYVPKHHGSCFDTLSLTEDSFGPFEPVSTKVNYQSGTFTFILKADGTLSSISVSEPANVVCKLKKGISIDADFTGTWKQDYTFTY